MLDTAQGDAAPPADERAPTDERAATEEPKGCLFALSQPPLMIFLAVIGVLILMGTLHDLLGP